MSADPTIPTAPETSSPSVEFVRQNRQAVLGILLFIGLLGLGLTVFCAGKSFGYWSQAGDKATKELEIEPEADPAKGKKSAKTPIPYQSDYILGAICSAMLMICGFGLTAVTAMTPESFSKSEQLFQARKTILMTGGLVGLVLMISGTAFFIFYFKSVSNWIDGKETSAAKYVLLPILTFLLGAGLAFISTGPARAEERNNLLLRRLIYGSNLMISVFLVGLLLVVLNVFVALRLPSKLDTTASGVNSIVLSQSTKDYLLNLNQKVVIHSLTIEDEDPVIQDVRRLLNAVAEVNPTLITIKEYTPVLNREAIVKLKNRFPIITDNFGLVVTIEDDEKRARFVSLNSMIKREGGGFRGGDAKITFEGEAKLMAELIALADGNRDTVIYFTQSARELAIEPSSDPRNRPTESRTAFQLKSVLEKSYLQAKVLPEDPNPTVPVKIPDDCSVLVVADPLTALSPKLIDAIKEYMNKPRGEKRGRLLVMAGAHPSELGNNLLAIGLEELLVEYGISLRPKAVYAEPQTGRANAMLGGMPEQLIESGNTIALSFSKIPFPFTNCRAIDFLQNPPPSGARPQELFLSSESRFTWREPEFLTNPEQEWESIVKNQSPELLKRKEILSRRDSQILAATASDETGGRLILFGTGSVFSDETGKRYRGRPVQAELFAACCNWLVQRPAAANIAGKTYGQYLPPSNPSVSTVLYLPVGVVLLGILAIGSGVWIFRRK